MTHQVDLEDGKVTVTGNAGGHPITLEGKIKNCTLKVERSRDDSEYFGRPFLFVNNERYFLEFDVVDGTAYTIKTAPRVAVERTARIEAVDRTVEALEKARGQAGAPKNARFTLSRMLDRTAELQVGKPTPIVVEFYWSEHV